MKSTGPDDAPPPFVLGSAAPEPAPGTAKARPLPGAGLRAPTPEETRAYVHLLNNLRPPTQAELRARPGPHGEPFRLPGPDAG
jgi:hypothetical protein